MRGRVILAVAALWLAALLLAYAHLPHAPRATPAAERRAARRPRTAHRHSHSDDDDDVAGDAVLRVLLRDARDRAAYRALAGARRGDEAAMRLRIAARTAAMARDAAPQQRADGD